MHQPEELQFGVLTSHPDEWNALEDIPNNVGVFPFYHQSAEDFILSLASWAHDNKTSRQSVLLLLDDLEAASNLDFDARQNLRWLLLRGPARRVWPIITLNPNRMENICPGWKRSILASSAQYKTHNTLNNWTLKVRNWILSTADRNLLYEKETTGFDFGYQV